MLRSRSRTALCAAIALLMMLLLCLHTSIRDHIFLGGPGPTGDDKHLLLSSTYVSGKPKPSGVAYSKTVVVARLESEDVSWLEKSDISVDKAIYVVDNPSLSPGFTVPQNKGHEAMVYLSYIIDYYDRLSDITIFVHSHQLTWHNNDILYSDMLKTIEHLSEAHVSRQGYFNLRCHHEPGCPDWLHLDRPHKELDTHRKMEEKTFSLKVWQQLHPGVEPPHAISQPCCAQFAVSKERIHANPRSEYIRYRDWILATELDDTFSGRIMEYSWQFLFAGVAELCPAMNVCYCDGYGICFGGAQEMEDWFTLRTSIGNMTSYADTLASESGMEEKVREMRDRADETERQVQKLKLKAFERGKNPELRALEVGRPWTAGDGY